MFKRNRTKFKLIHDVIYGILLAIFGVLSITHGEGIFVGLFFALIGILTTVFHLINIIRKKEVSQCKVNIEATDSQQEKEKSFDEKLRELKALKDDEIIREEEYQVKRKQILGKRNRTKFNLIIEVICGISITLLGVVSVIRGESIFIGLCYALIGIETTNSQLINILSKKRSFTA